MIKFLLSLLGRPDREPRPAPLRTTPPETPKQAWPPGHFYSPIPDYSDVDRGHAPGGDPLLGINLNEEVQISVLAELEQVYPLLRFPEKKRADRRYYYDNGSFGALDAVSLAAIGRLYSPRRVIEVGSGHSSAALLDLRDDGLLPNCDFTFIDPDFSRLEALLLPGDLQRITRLESKVQDVSLDRFRDLTANDLLLIDSSHVSKVGSDVNHLLFQVFPLLRPGVMIHIHDIFASFEYPKEWHKEGRYWNEQYLMRAFLMYNPAFEILFLSGYMFNRYNDRFRTKMPATVLTGGGQLWLRKT